MADNCGTDRDYWRRFPPELAQQPPNSHLSVLLGWAASPEEIRERFAPFGALQHVWVVWDTQAKEPLDVVYLKYARASQALRAKEKMHGQYFSLGATRPMKVFLTLSKVSRSPEDIGTGIYVNVPKSFTEENLKDAFKIYGDIDLCIMQQKENKYVAYIRFLRPSQAALAIEECDQNYNAVWADVKTATPESSEHRSSVKCPTPEKKSNNVERSNSNPLGYNKPFSDPVSKAHDSHEHIPYMSGEKQETNSRRIQGSNLITLEELPDLASLERSHESLSRRLSVVSEFPFLHEQLFNLFDLVPGLESCEVHRGLCSNRAYAVIQYSTIASAIYAKHKLHGFEYPFGNWLLVTFIEDRKDGNDLLKPQTAQEMTSPLTSTKWSSSLALQVLDSSQSSNPPPQLQTDAELPSSKRKAPPDSSVRERLFIVFNPHPLPQDILDDVLSRYGNFINIYLLPGENVGYAMFADRASASDAIAGLHGKTVNGVRLKVILADLPTGNSNKHQRTF
ncbi:RNA-binding protein 45-like [Elgaria multicarinata webbii]|uniref:RNA-binding protein 45-like n=1 Tax=Elgaria multicarinata webbii TaxID=159646 RepID=UPI002FCCD74F